MKKRNTHGGSRKGAGRPTGTTKAEETKVMRVPLSIVAKVEGMIRTARKKFQPVDAVLAAPAVVGLIISML